MKTTFLSRSNRRLLVSLVAFLIVAAFFASTITADAVNLQNPPPAESGGLHNALAEKIQGEGTVLVKNAVNDETGEPCLPLDKTNTTSEPVREDRVNLLGYATTQWLSSGTGSGRVRADQASNLAAGAGSAARSIGLKRAFENYGIPFNTELVGTGNSTHNGTQGIYIGQRPWYELNKTWKRPYEVSIIIEPDINAATPYTESIKNNAIQYSDVAIVTLARLTGEAHDIPKVQYKLSQGTTSSSPATINSTTDTTRHGLEISTEEEALLRWAGENFKKTIVLINSSNTMELGFLDTIPGLDACLIVGQTGQVGAAAIPKILYGDITPSGRLIDTQPYSHKDNPVYYASGIGHTGVYAGTESSTACSNTNNIPYPAGIALNSRPDAATNIGVTYVDYTENIYLGYKWWETANVEGYWAGRERQTPDGIKTGYDAVVQFPFGFGLSYTTFSYEIMGQSVTTDPEQSLKNGTVKWKVKVTNIGACSGKDVVQLYFTPPYTDGGIEKSSTTLAAFAKTEILAPGESQTLSLSFKVEDMASYDCYDKNQNGFKGYELEGGAYSVKLLSDSHRLSGGIEGGTFTTTQSITIPAGGFRYETDTVTGSTVENRFTGDNAEVGIPIDGSKEMKGGAPAPVQYMTRASFATDFTDSLVQGRTLTNLLKKYNKYTNHTGMATANDDGTGGNWNGVTMAAAWNNDTSKNGGQPYEMPATSNGGTMIIGTGPNTQHALNSTWKISEKGLELGADYDHADWMPLVQQASLDQSARLAVKNYQALSGSGSPQLGSATAAPYINKPFTTERDGPNQSGGWHDTQYGTGFPTVPVLSQTWNVELAMDFGLAFGEEAISAMCGPMSAGLCPAINMHRSPFSGRNYEYWSEDALITGKMAAAQIKGMLAKGLTSTLKHVVLYEQENYRDGLYTWLTEQNLRENYLKPFKIVIQEAKVTGMMSSYNRIGALGTSESYGLITEILRGEMGFKGYMVTDYADFGFYMTMDAGLRAGSDLSLGNNNAWRIQEGITTSGSGTNTTVTVQSARLAQALQRSTKNLLYTICNASYTKAEYESITNNSDKVNAAISELKTEMNKLLTDDVSAAAKSNMDAVVTYYQNVKMPRYAVNDGDIAFLTEQALGILENMAEQETEYIPKESQNIPTGITATKTDTTVTLTQKTGVEYGKMNQDSRIVWQDSNQFTGLTPNTQYTLYFRMKETATHAPSPTDSIVVTTNAANTGGNEENQEDPKGGCGCGTIGNTSETLTGLLSLSLLGITLCILCQLGYKPRKKDPIVK